MRDGPTNGKVLLRGLVLRPRLDAMGAISARNEQWEHCLQVMAPCPFKFYTPIV
jgi:hypothetical protein